MLALRLKSCVISTAPIIFCASYNGVYRTTDLCENWAKKSNGLPTNGSVFCLFVDGNRIYCGMQQAVYYSDDAGENWTSMSSGLPNHYIICIRKMDGVLYACVGTQPQVYYWSGSTWTACTTITSGSSPAGHYLLVNGSSLFCCTEGPTAVGGVWRSDNAGVTWTLKASGITNDYGYYFEKVSTTLYAGTEESGFFVSTDNGENWTPIDTGEMPASGGSPCCGIVIQDDNMIIAYRTNTVGVWRSTNGGVDWSLSASGFTPNCLRGVGDKQGGQYLFTAKADKIYMSSDYGENWTEKQTGYSGWMAYDFVGM